MIRLALLLLAVATVPAAAARAADLAVTLTDIPDSRGRLVVGVCTRAEFLHPVCRYHASGEATKGRETLVVRGIVPGVYAVTAFQDVNESGRMTTNFFGVPTEPVGFSRNPPLGFHAPRFDASAVSIPPEGGAVTIRLGRY